MIFGRIRLWFSKRQSRLNRIWVGQEAIFDVFQRPEDVLRNDRAVCHYPNGKGLKKEIKKKEPWQDFSYGVITYHIWRFCLSIRTPKYHAKNKNLW